MGKLAQAAGVAKLEGAVTVTFPNGTRTYTTEDAANKAVGSAAVTHRRGGFFCETGSAHDGDAVVDAPKAAPKAAPTPSKKKT